MKKWLAASAVLFALAVACPAQELTPEQSRALGETLALLAKSQGLSGEGKTGEALKAAEGALAVAEGAFSESHLVVALALDMLGALHVQREDFRGAESSYARALDALSRGAEVREHNLALLLGVGSEEQKRLYLATLQNETDAVVSFHARDAREDPAAAELALITLLRRKGRVLDAVADQTAALRRRLDARDRALLDELSAARSALARLVLKGADDADPKDAQRAEVSRLKSEIDRLEAEVSARSAEFRAQSRPVTLRAVQEALPVGAALVEFVLYRPFDVKAAGKASRFGAARYAAYILTREGRPRFVELGEAEALDDAALAWRRALADPSNPEAAGRGRALEEKLVRPLRPLLGATRRLFLSPDGALNLIPFGALVDGRDRYLIEDYSITYLTSGRDLLRLQLAAPARQPPLVLADPLFEAAQGLLPASASSSNDPATAPPTTPDVVEDPRGLLLGASPSSPRPRLTGENPLLRSGLALAGANRGQGGAGEDGVLTALEAAGLDLRGTRLVVLSACETGVGEVKNGEGVYGLRRALVLAGSESQVMSLWQVDDAATRDLMIAYYRRLRAGEGRTDALRQVQLEMIRGAKSSTLGPRRGLSSATASAARDRRHPFFWAAFIQSGDWRPMSAGR